MNTFYYAVYCVVICDSIASCLIPVKESCGNLPAVSRSFLTPLPISRSRSRGTSRHSFKKKMGEGPSLTLR